MINIHDVVKEFAVSPHVERYGNGHINDTYLVTQDRYILQRINTNIFKDPYGLMENIENVTVFLREKIVMMDGDPERETLSVIPTIHGESCYKYDENNYFRMYKFVENTVAIENDKTYETLYQAGRGFGRFQKMLDDFPVEKLHETIKDFHHTPKRVEALKNAIAQDAAGRAADVQEEIRFALDHTDFTHAVVNGLEEGTIPLRITHNDTKINNILFDENTLEAVCVIDLDTVMPGSALYDFGDALRIGGSTGAEDEVDLDKVSFDLEAFRAFVKGYCGEMGEKLTPREVELLPLSAKLMTYECGIRFLTDYLNGDTYFKIHHPGHNLDRARNQFKLVADMDAKQELMKEIIQEVMS